MPFEFCPQVLEGVISIHPRLFGDARGRFLESYRREDFLAAGIGEPFVQDNFSTSSRGVLRGLHYQLPPHAQGKLVWVTRGTVFDVCVDLRRYSSTFGQWLGEELDGERHEMLYIPPGFGHGFVVLSEQAEFFYKCTAQYAPESERGIRWDDPDLAIDWPLTDVIVSAKDAALPRLADADVFESPPG